MVAARASRRSVASSSKPRSCSSGRSSDQRGNRRRVMPSPRKPGTELVVDRGVVEEVEMRQAGKPPAVLVGERDAALATAARRAGDTDEQIADEGPERLAADGGGDERERGVGQERHVAAAIGEQLVAI